MPKREVRLEPFDPELHSQRLRDWLHRPHVARWWGDPQLALESSLRCSPESHAVIVVGGAPVGYLCWRTPPQNELEAAGLTDLPEGLVDIDVFIGEPEFMGRGVGPRSLGLLLARWRMDPSVTVAGVGTSVSNERAIRAFEKAGFRRFREFQDPEFGGCWYMVVEVRDAT
ncbi:MAG: acetyltransferase [bacterium]|nr:acetyltransferase [bacterium]